MFYMCLGKESDLIVANRKKSYLFFSFKQKMSMQMCILKKKPVHPTTYS